MPAAANFCLIFQSARDCIPKSALLDRPQQKVHILSSRATSINYYNKTAQQYQGQEEVLLPTSARVPSQDEIQATAACCDQAACCQLHAGVLVDHERKINPSPTKSKPPLHSFHFPINESCALRPLFLSIIINSEKTPNRVLLASQNPGRRLRILTI